MTSAAENHYAERVRQLLNVPVTRLSVVGAQHGYQHLTATLGDGRAVFAKAVPAEVGPAKAVPAEAVPAEAGPGKAGPGEEGPRPAARRRGGRLRRALAGLHREPAA